MKAHGELTYCPTCGEEVYPASQACASCEIKKYKIEHVNTGCLYQADGQKITILHGFNQTHLFDHSRMVDITIEAGNLTAMQAVWKYVKGEYTLLKLDSWGIRSKVAEFYKTAEFKDISQEYMFMVKFG